MQTFGSRLKKKEDGFISAEGSATQIGTLTYSVGYTAESKEETQGRECGKRAQQTARKDCSDDNYGNGSIFMFENIFILKVLAYLNFFLKISNLQMYQEN